MSQTHRDQPAAKSNDRVLHLLFGAVLLAYVAIGVRCLRAPFFPLDDLDEFYLIRTSKSWLSLLGTDLYSFFRPVKNMLFVLYDWLYNHGGIAAVRMVPLIIGLLSALAVFKFCCRVLGSRMWALMAMAAWLLAPTLVSSMAWLSASNILLMTGLAAAALTCHDLACEAIPPATGGARGPVGMWTAFAALSLMLALGSYEGAISIVPLFFLLDWFLRPARLRLASTWRLYFLYGVVAAAYLVFRQHAQATQTILGGFSGVSRAHAAMSSGYLTVLHAGKWLWPFSGMAVIGGYYWGQVPMVELAACYLVVVAAVLFSIGLRRRYPCATFGILFFLLAFAPMSNLLGFRNGPYCDSYIALASVGAAITAVATIRALWSLRMTGTARLAALAIVTLLAASRVAAAFEAAAWSNTWNDPTVAYERSLQTFPLAFDAMTELAKDYESRKQYRKADELAAKSIALAPDRSGPYAVRAVVAEREGRIQDALNWLTVYRRYVRDGTRSWDLAFEADIYSDHLGQPERAEALYQKAVAERPWSQDTLRAAYELAYMEAQQGHQAKAISLWEELLTYAPDDAVLHWNLSIAYAQQGDQQRAAYHRSRLGQKPATPPADDKKF